MAAKLFLLLVALFGLMWFLFWYGKADREQRNKSLISILLYGIAAALLILVVTGKIPWLFAVLGAAVPWINRVLTVRSIWHRFSHKNRDWTRQSHKSSRTSSMTADEAWEILGIKPGADKQEIIEAHKKMMQKIHPDKGGSSTLASQVNQAKDILLNS